MTYTDPQILDTTLRDGSYAVDFQFTAEDTALIASALESAGIRLIEIGHGLGLGAARAGKGEPAASDEEHMSAARGVLQEAAFGMFFIPGLGKEDDIRRAAELGLGFIRIGTNITELESGLEFVRHAKQCGLMVFSNLMKSYAVDAETFASRAETAANAGADCVCLVDSAGCMLPGEVRQYVICARGLTDTPIGFHGHDNLCLAMANTLAAHDAGALILDASVQGIGRSEGNTVTEVLAAVLQKQGAMADLDVDALLDAGEAFIAPLMRNRGRSALGVTSGRARFHSSFLGRAMQTAARYGIDVRRLIVELGERDPVNAPEDVLESVARDLAASGPRPAPRVDVATQANREAGGFDVALDARTRELKEKSRKLGLPSVLNVVAGPFEPTHVSPFVQTSYGCAIANVMLREPERLHAVLAAAEGKADFVLLDAGRSPVPGGVLKQTVLLTYSDKEMWAHAAVVHLAKLLPGGLTGKCVALTGVPALATRAALALSEAGASVRLDERLEDEARALMRFAPGVSCEPLESAAAEADAVVSLSPRDPAVDAPVVERMAGEALLYDGGIGSLSPEAVEVAEARGMRVVRIDMRPSLASTALELIGIRRVVEEHMGRETWEGVPVVAGGLLGKAGEVIVDSISRPARVIGVADGRGGIVPADSEAPEVLTVRRAIAQRMLERQARQA